MSTITTQTCDRCGEVVPRDKDHQFWEIGVLAKCKPQTVAHNGLWQIDKQYKMDVCRPCLFNLGLIAIKHVPPQAPPPSLEDVIREIVAEEVQSAIENT